jgi:hypothetical protein
LVPNSTDAATSGEGVKGVVKGIVQDVQENVFPVVAELADKDNQMRVQKVKLPP